VSQSQLEEDGYAMIESQPQANNGMHPTANIAGGGDEYER